MMNEGATDDAAEPMSGRRIEHDLGQQRRLTVQLPEDYERDARSYPLLLCLDAQWTLGTVSDIALLLGLSRRMPRVIVAGLGWHYAEVRDIVAARACAYTPTVAVFPPEVVAPGGRALVAGGGADYLEFLAADVMQLLVRTYRVTATERTVIGHSLSGLFALFAATRRPALFDRYLLASPSVWWQDRIILSLLAEGPDLRGRLYLTRGEDETTVAGCAMIDTAREIADFLRARHAALEVHFEVLAGEFHESTIAGSATRGLRWLFATA